MILLLLNIIWIRAGTSFEYPRILWLEPVAGFSGLASIYRWKWKNWTRYMDVADG